MIWHVYQKAIESQVGDVFVATDNKQIYDEVIKFGGNVIMTSSDHLSGTDRLAEVASIKNFHIDDIVVNVQGDEPMVPPKCIKMLSKIFLNNNDADIATLSCPILSKEELFDPNVVKVVLRKDKKALYFSRAPIPWDRDGFKEGEVNQICYASYQRHIGMYAYKVDKLSLLSNLAASELEKCESLEQLRALENGMNIFVEKLDFQVPHGIDTIEDFNNIKRLMEDQ